jgi:hypothetical protein
MAGHPDTDVEVWRRQGKRRRLLTTRRPVEAKDTPQTRVVIQEACRVARVPWSDLEVRVRIPRSARWETFYVD